MQVDLKAQMDTLLQTPPQEQAMEQSRWRLRDLIEHVPGVNSRRGVWRVLQKLGFRYRRGWSHQVSPDPWAALQHRAQPPSDQIVVLWLDELTF
jgi:transposase